MPVCRKNRARHSRNQKNDKNVHIRVGATLVALQREAEASPTQLKRNHPLPPLPPRGGGLGWGGCFLLNKYSRNRTLAAQRLSFSCFPLRGRKVQRPSLSGYSITGPIAFTAKAFPLPAFQRQGEKTSSSAISTSAVRHALMSARKEVMIHHLIQQPLGKLRGQCGVFQPQQIAERIICHTQCNRPWRGIILEEDSRGLRQVDIC